MRRNVEGFAHEVKDAFLRYPWPGNVRELKNMIERGVIMCDEQIIERKHLPLELTHQPQEIIPLSEIEKGHIAAALHRFHGNISRTAKALQIPRTTLRDKIRDLGIHYKA
jgi:DNA-binding NtrC family response regulator